MSPRQEEASQTDVSWDEVPAFLSTECNDVELSEDNEDLPRGQTLPTPETLGHEAGPAHLIHDAAFQQYQRSRTVQRRRRCHNNRFGVLIGTGHFVSTCLLITLTFSNDSLLSPASANETDSRLTGIHGKLRRAGYRYRVTSSEVGSAGHRKHYHILVDLEGRGLRGFIDGLEETSRDFRNFARDWVPDDRIAHLQREYDQWVASGSSGHRRGRSAIECLAGDYLARCWGLGYVDAAELPRDAGRCYLLKFLYQGDMKPQEGVRVSYSRPASQNWAYGAVPVVYAHEGKCCRYRPRDPAWVSGQVALLNRRDARRRSVHKRRRFVSVAPTPHEDDLDVLEEAS